MFFLSKVVDNRHVQYLYIDIQIFIKSCFININILPIGYQPQERENKRFFVPHRPQATAPQAELFCPPA